MLRLKAAPDRRRARACSTTRFGDLVHGPIERTAPLPPEVRTTIALELPRIALTLDQYRVGDLFRLIGAINALESSVRATSSGLAPT